MNATKKNDANGWTLFRRKDDGRACVRFKVERTGTWKDHRIPPEHATSTRLAEKYGAFYVAEYNKTIDGKPLAPIDVPTEEKPITIRDLADKWIDLRENDPKLSPSIREQNASNMRTHVLHYAEIADAPIESLGSGTLRTWLRKVRDTGLVKTVKGGTRDKPKLERTGEQLAPFTTRNIVNSLTAFFADSMAEEWITLPANPMHHPGVRKEVPRGETIGGEETIAHLSRPIAQRLMVAKTTPDNRTLRYLLACLTGMRDGEIAGLRWDDIDFEAKTISVTKNLARNGPAG